MPLPEVRMANAHPPCLQGSTLHDPTDTLPRYFPWPPFDPRRRRPLAPRADCAHRPRPLEAGLYGAVPDRLLSAAVGLWHGPADAGGAVEPAARDAPCRRPAHA